VLAGRYELGELLGTGGMAQVYAATDRRLGRTVAVKLLRPDLADDDSVRARFQREAHSAASLNHPAIVGVHDTGDGTAEPFIVMEFVPGRTLRETMTEGQPMAVDQALRITSDVLTALEFAHQGGIVHRDIKPGNIMITPDGVVKVMDFGISRAVTDHVTITQTVVGTPAYLSPEHAEGRPVDFRSDLYSTGCVLFELLTGQPPFSAESPIVVAVQHIQETPRVPSTINPALSPALDEIVAKALVKDRDQRYQTAAEFRAAIEAVRADGTGSLPVPVPNGGPAVDDTAAIVMDTTARMPSSAPPLPAELVPTAAEAGPASTLPPDYLAEPAASGRRRWPLVAVGAVAAVLVVGGVVFAVSQRSSGGGGAEPVRTAKPIVVDAFDVKTMDPVSNADLQSSVVEMKLAGTVKEFSMHNTVSQIDLANRVGPWVQPEKKDGQNVVTISTDVLFQFGKADINEAGAKAIAEAVKPVPNKATIDVTGYTDSVGTDEDNLALSQARADAVAAIIAKERPDLTVNAVGMGSQDPVAENTQGGEDYPEGRAQNRRVEIRYG